MLNSVIYIVYSALGPWHAVIAYDACVRLCLHAWAKGCMEAPMFLENECALLRNTFGYAYFLLILSTMLCCRTQLSLLCFCIYMKIYDNNFEQRVPFQFHEVLL